MGRQLQYVGLERVISKVYRDLGVEEISETDLVEWSGEALELIGAITLYEESVAIVEVENHQAKLPHGLHAIIQVARNNKWEKSNKKICPADIIYDCEITEETNINECKPNTDGVPIDCKGTPITGYEIAYYRPYFDLRYEYIDWCSCSMYKQNFTPVRLANHTFFNSIVCAEDTQIYNGNSSDEYTIVGDSIRTSFKDGQLAISYYKQKIDTETGYPMIPDDVSVISAIFWYIAWKYNTRLWMMGREGYADKMQLSEQQWHWYCKQAGTNQMMIYGIDQHENLKDMRHQLIPKQNRYYGFFGNMSRPENTMFKHGGRQNFNVR
jgi:hypothetical protein